MGCLVAVGFTILFFFAVIRISDFLNSCSNKKFAYKTSLQEYNGLTKMQELMNSCGDGHYKEKEYKQVRFTFEQVEKFFNLNPEKFSIVNYRVIYENGANGYTVLLDKKGYFKFVKMYNDYTNHKKEVEKEKKLTENTMSMLNDIQNEINDVKEKSEKELNEVTKHIKEVVSK